MANFTGDTVAVITGTGSNLQTALASKVCRWFKDQGRTGRVLNVSSMGRELFDHPLSGLVTAQAGIAGLTRSLTLELAPLGIEVKLIEPGSRKLYYAGIDRV